MPDNHAASAFGGTGKGCGGLMQPLSGLRVIRRRFPSVGPRPLCPRRSNAGLNDAIPSGLGCRGGFGAEGGGVELW